MTCVLMWSISDDPFLDEHVVIVEKVQRCFVNGQNAFDAVHYFLLLHWLNRTNIAFKQEMNYIPMLCTMSSGMLFPISCKSSRVAFV